jgi:hypothetical protein
MESIIILTSESFKLFGTRIIDVPDLMSLMTKSLFNISVLFVIIRLIYYPATLRKDYQFTFFMIGIILFLLCFLLENVKLEVGFALGLFAVFGILRYRTSLIPIKEMTYLFVVIGISVMNSLASKRATYAELLFTNSMIIGALYFLENLKREISKTIVYEKLDMIVEERREELIKDIEARTSLKINRLEVGNVDFMRDIAYIDIFYYPSGPVSNPLGSSGGSQNDD